MSLSFLYREVKIGNRRVPLPYIIWFAFGFIAVLLEVLRHSYNNYLIFEHVFWHVLGKKNLYLAYPEEYADHNFYGPVFSFVIAPFAVLPNWLGAVLWVIANAVVLFIAIRQLPLTERAKQTILLISAIEFMTSCHNVQYNPMVAAWIIFSYTFIQKGKDFWGAFFMVLGFITKIYGIAGIVFFLFSRHKVRYIASSIFWLVVLFCLPMLISSPAYIVQTYKDWMVTLPAKNLHNIDISYVNMQDLSVMGIIRRTFRMAGLSNLVVVGPAAVLLALPLLRIQLYKNVVFQLTYLSICLICVVIYSSGAESATYVIAMAGVAIWYVLRMHKASNGDIAALVFALFVTSLCSTDLVPQFIKHDIVRTYALKSLPCFIVWCMLVYDAAFRKPDQWQSPAIQEEPVLSSIDNVASAVKL